MATLQECWELYEKERLPLCVDQKRQIMAYKAFFKNPCFELLCNEIGDIRYTSAAITFFSESPNTDRRTLTTIRAVLRHAHKRGILDRVPDILLPGYRPQARAIPALLVDLLIRQADACKALSTFVRIALSTGARPGAICDLTWDRVDLQNKVISFIDPSMSKFERRKRRANVPINDTLHEFLSQLGRASHNYVVDNDGKRVIRINQLWKKHINVGMPVTPHALRHTVATNVARGHGLLIASKLLGHSSTRTTEQVYVNIGIDDLRDAVSTMESGK